LLAATGITRFQIVDQGADRNTSADEDRFSTEDVGVAVDYR
jgi:hypothetical protein